MYHKFRTNLKAAGSREWSYLLSGNLRFLHWVFLDDSLPIPLRLEAITALIKRGLLTEKHLVRIDAILKDEDWDIRRWGLLILFKLGRFEEQLLKDSDWKVRKFSEYLLTKA